MPVLFEGGDPEFEPEKPDVYDTEIKRGRKLIRVGLLMLVLGLAMCLFFIILVVAVVPASLQNSPDDEISQVHLSVLDISDAGDAGGNWTTRGYANSRIANSRTGHLADWSTSGLDNSRTSQLADWTSRGLDNSRSGRCRQKDEN